MLRSLGLMLGIGLAVALSAPVFAQDKKKAKEVELKGTITCAKCDLNLEKACATVIKVKGKDGKDVVYYLDAKSHKAHHAKVCNEAKEGVVVGTVKKDGKKMVVTATNVEFK